MNFKRPFNFSAWVEAHRHLLKPPVGNRQIYTGNKDFIVMVVGGPNRRKDYHCNQGEELFYQFEGDMVLRIIEDNKPVNIPIKEGEIFLLPANVPHSPQRPAHSVGLVIERYRKKTERDSFQWYCENCNHKLFEKSFLLTDIVTQLPEVMREFYDSESLRTCKRCQTVMPKI